MDEDELETYLDAIDLLDERLGVSDIRVETPVCEQLRDDYGYRVPGSFRTSPTSTYG